MELLPCTTSTIVYTPFQFSKIKEMMLMTMLIPLPRNARREQYGSPAECHHSPPGTRGEVRDTNQLGVTFKTYLPSCFPLPPSRGVRQQMEITSQPSLQVSGGRISFSSPMATHQSTHEHTAQITVAQRKEGVQNVDNSVMFEHMRRHAQIEEW